jgi:hypothetical protein
VPSKKISLARAALAAAALAAAAPSVASAAIAPGPADPNTSMPAFFTDGADGLKLQPCTDSLVLCPGVRPNLGAPLAVPGNFPSGAEGFYWSADAEFHGALAAGRTVVHFALEQAFVNGVVRRGEQMVFSRIRFRVPGLAPGRYRIQHPFGQDFFDVGAGGTINFTEDSGCLAVGCDPATASYGRLTSFLRWTPDAATPAGYVADPAVSHTVTGSPLGRNRVVVDQVNAAGGVVRNVDSTSLFVVNGERSAGTVPAPRAFIDTSADALDFGARVTNDAPATRTLTITNSGVAPLNVGTAVTGPNAADFPITAACPSPLAPGASCTVAVAFAAPAGPASARSATLTIGSDAANAPSLSVPLTGLVTGVFVPPAVAPAASGAVAGTSARARARALRTFRVSVAGRVRFGVARRGVRIVARLPQGTRRVRLTLLRAGKVVTTRTLRRTAGSRVFRVKATRRGRYRLVVTAVGAGFTVKRSVTFTVVR